MLKEIYENVVNHLRDAIIECYNKRLISICVFGSVGRGTPGPSSDIDILIVANPLPKGRVRRVQEFEKVEETLYPMIKQAMKKDIFIEISPVIKTPSEMNQGSWLFLDIIEDGKILYDYNNFLFNYFKKLKDKLNQLGSKRIKQGESWFWILKETLKPGEVIDI